MTQLRALLEACAGRTLDVMLPMVSSLDELADARAALTAAATASRTAGAPIASDVRLRIMVEVPAVAVLADMFAPVVDFLSIGTNDLTQYTLAADRTHAALAELASPLQPAVLRLVSGVVDAARRTGRPVTVCGEAAADPVAGPILAGLGVDILSVAPTAVPGVAARLAAVERETAERVGRASLSAGSLADVRPARPRARRLTQERNDFFDEDVERLALDAGIEAREVRPEDEQPVVAERVGERSHAARRPLRASRTASGAERRRRRDRRSAAACGDPASHAPRSCRRTSRPCSGRRRGCAPRRPRHATRTPSGARRS